MRQLLFLFLSGLLCHSVFAQNDSLKTQGVYKVYTKYELPISAVSYLGIITGYSAIDNHSNTTKETALSIKASDVNSFDRSVTDFPYSKYDHHHLVSDYWMKGMIAAPALLFLKKDLRKDWLSISTLYLESHLASAGLFLLGQRTVRKHRPIVYNADAPLSLRTGVNTNNSFFSGHVNTTATASFFIAKIWNDYHPNYSVWKKLAIYTAAAIPPYIVAYNRIRAGKHFRTDVAVGFLVGAACGILVPEFRRNKARKNQSISWVPVMGSDMVGLNCTVRFN
jgi:membrane-associated phospholipid phosphatase